LALAELGRDADAWRCFNILNPLKHALDREAAERYRVEPYVVAADVYGDEAYLGRGGWTWYTGSAGWLYRFAVEGILGITRRGDTLFIRPCLPPEWKGFEATLTIADRVYGIAVKRSDGGNYDVSVDGKKLADLESGFALTRSQ